MTLKWFTIYLKRKYKLIARDSVTDWDTDIKIDRKTDRRRKKDRQKDRQTEKVVGFVLLSQEQDFFFFEKKISLKNF